MQHNKLPNVWAKHVRKGITTEDEIMQGIVKLKEEMEKKMRDVQKLN